VLEDQPPAGVSLDAISAVQLSIVGADAETALARYDSRAAHAPGKAQPDDRLAGLSDFARQQAAMAPRPPPEDMDSLAAARPAAGLLRLSVRLDMELELPLEPDGARASRLLRACAPLEEAPAMGRLVQAVHAARSVHPAALTFGVPAWADKVPPGVYGGELRRWSELAIVTWTVGTVFWAAWQLYHNSDYVHAAFEPLVRFVYYYCDQTLDMIDDYLRWLTLIFYAWFRPVVIVISSLWSSLRPLFTPFLRVLPPILKKLAPLIGKIERVAKMVRAPFATRLNRREMERPRRFLSQYVVLSWRCVVLAHRFRDGRAQGNCSHSLQCSLICCESHTSCSAIQDLGSTSANCWCSGRPFFDSVVPRCGSSCRNARISTQAS
jgi:hypothetical protein